MSYIIFLRFVFFFVIFTVYTSTVKNSNSLLCTRAYDARASTILDIHVRKHCLPSVVENNRFILCDARAHVADA